MAALTKPQFTEQDFLDLTQKLAVYESDRQGLIIQNQQYQAQLKDLSNTTKAIKDGSLIYRKMIEAKRMLGYISKDQVNTGQGFKFRGIDQFQNALKPILDKCGIGIRVETLQNQEQVTEAVTTDKQGNVTSKKTKHSRITMKYVFFAEDGSEMFSSLPAEGVDPGDKGTNKALSAAFKYCMIQSFCVPTEDQEEGDKTVSTITPENKGYKAKSGTKDINTNVSLEPQKGTEATPGAITPTLAAQPTPSVPSVGTDTKTVSPTSFRRNKIVANPAPTVSRDI